MATIAGCEDCVVSACRRFVRLRSGFVRPLFVVSPCGRRRVCGGARGAGAIIANQSLDGAAGAAGAASGRGGGRRGQGSGRRLKPAPNVVTLGLASNTPRRRPLNIDAVLAEVDEEEEPL